MDVRHLRYFVTVAEEMHFARAAERLNITPSTLSHQIKVLETSVGARLFTRSTKSAIALTHVGKDFLEEARLVLKQFEQAARVGRRAARGQAGSISVGFILSASCSGAVTSSIANFRKSHPDVSFNLHKMETFPQMKALTEGALDVAFAREPRNYPSELAGFVIDKQPICLAIPENHPLAKYKAIEVNMLNGESLVTSLIELEVGAWDNIAAVAPSEMSFQIVARYPDAFSVLNGVGAGLGVAIMSESLSRISVPGVIFRKFKKLDKAIEHVAIYRKNERAPVVKAFIDNLRKMAKSKPEA